MQIQGTGHGDFVQAKDGSWWVVFLAYRNFGGSYHHIGRETCLAPVEWKTGEWPVINGGNPIDTVMQVKTLAPQKPQARHIRTLFNNRALGAEWVYIQNPLLDNYQQKDGKLRLTPHKWLADNDQPTFIGRRQESANIYVETEVNLYEHNLAHGGLAIYQINDGYIRFYASDEGVCVPQHRTLA